MIINGGHSSCRSFGLIIVAMIKVGERVRVKGDTQDYILVDASKTYAGEVIGRQEGHLLVRLDEPVTRGVNKFEEVSVPEQRARPE